MIRSGSSGVGHTVGDVTVNDVGDADAQRFEVRRVWMPSSGVESWTVVGPDGRPVAVVEEFLAWLTHIERSPNTVEAYARDLRLFWLFLGCRGLSWETVTVGELGEFAAWARRPAENVIVLSEVAARRSARTVNRMLAAVVGFFEFQARRGNSLARELVVQTRSGRGGYKRSTRSQLIDAVPATPASGLRAQCVPHRAHDHPIALCFIVAAAGAPAAMRLGHGRARQALRP